MLLKQLSPRHAKRPGMPLMACLKKEKREKRSGTCCNNDIRVLQKCQQRCSLLTLQNKSLGLGKAKWHPFLQCFTLILTSACVLEGCRTSNWTAVERNQCCYTPAGWQSRVGASGWCWLRMYWPPSNRARAASTRKGELFPTNSYMTLPKGGPTAKERKGHSCEDSDSEQTPWERLGIVLLAQNNQKPSLEIPTKITDHGNNHIPHSPERSAM